MFALKLLSEIIIAIYLIAFSFQIINGRIKNKYDIVGIIILLVSFLIPFIYIIIRR